MGEEMSLDKDHKALLEQAIHKLKKTLDMLERAPTDPAALDTIDIAMGLLERQLEMNIEFVGEDPDFIDNDDEEETQLFLVDDTDNFELAPQKLNPLEEEMLMEEASFADQYEPVSEAQFLFFENEESNVPSADELEAWFNMPPPE